MNWNPARRSVAYVLVSVVFFAAVFAIAGTPRDAKPVRVTTVAEKTAVRYRGVTAQGWAHRFRHRTRQLQAARASVKAAVRPGYGSSWLERAFLCIHPHEGRWDDPSPPYWGGLQMDLEFQRHYGAWALRAFGTADKWPVSVQIAVAIQAYESGRGFGPWPRTRKMCGL